MYLVLVSITALILILKLNDYVDKYNLEEKNIFSQISVNIYCIWSEIQWYVHIV